MLLVVFHFLFAPWRWVATRALSLWRTLPALLPHRRGPPTMTPADATPLTDQQRLDRKAKYIQSIDREAICALASRHNNNLPCRLDKSSPMENGSFNVCFFVEFYTTPERIQWVVRVPIEPVVHRAWDKLQSEVCTIR